MLLFTNNQTKQRHPLIDKDVFYCIMIIMFFSTKKEFTR